MVFGLGSKRFLMTRLEDLLLLKAGSYLYFLSFINRLSIG